MKFKAVLAAPVQLSKLLQTLDKVADTCVVHLTPETVQFGVAAAEGKDNVHVSADVNQRALFFEYMVQSKAEGNRISFFVKTENLSRALRSCCSAKAERLQLKLTKKQGTPALSFEIVMERCAVQVLHEVPIRIVSDPQETLAYMEPPLGSESDSAVAVIFPQRDFKGLKNVVERMRSVSEWLRITTRRECGELGGEVDGSGTAQLELRVEKPELVSIKTTYPRLGVPTADPDEVDGGPSSPLDEAGAVGSGSVPGGVRRSDDDNTSRESSLVAKRRRVGGGAGGSGGAGDAVDAVAAGGVGGAGGGDGSRADEASASVEVKKLLRVLQSLSASDLKINNAIVCVVPNTMVILKIYLHHDDSGQSFLIYYLPVLAGTADD